MLCSVFIFTAQIQATVIIPWLALAVAILGVTASFISIKQSKDKMIRENKEKMASKPYVLDKVAKVDADLCNLKEQFDDHKHTNEREHDSLKEDIDKKLDLIIELVKSKSA